MPVVPFSLKDTPALIEKLFPAQKISIESYKEQMAGSGKTLTALGSYWKGRKPLILNRACVLGSLLPATGEPLKDLSIFEKLMALDEEALRYRLKEKNEKASKFFLAQEISLPERVSYKDWVSAASRPEECGDDLYKDIWDEVNQHLNTEARSFPELVEQLGIMRFGHRPNFSDVFSGSGQIPFEAARLGCDVYASDLNPIACMLTWGAFHIVGANEVEREKIKESQEILAQKVQKEIDVLEIETDGNGWRAKVFLYCLEVRCPQSGWLVPMLPTLIISKGYKVVAKLIPHFEEMCYEISVSYLNSDSEVESNSFGTIQDGYLVHSPDGVTIYRTKISTLRGDYSEKGQNKNNLRMWEKTDFTPRTSDLYQERLYCIQWVRPKSGTKKDEYQFRSVTLEDNYRETKVIQFLKNNIEEWQKKGWIPDMVIEPGEKTDEPIRTRGWTHWHHLFNPRQLLILGLIKKQIKGLEAFILTKFANNLSRLCAWETTPARKDKNGNQVGGASNNAKQVFTNQALNTMYNYGCRSSIDLEWAVGVKHYPLDSKINISVTSHPAQAINTPTDLFITDPPYGDAVKYEEILEFFIAWLRKNPPEEFKDWVWDSRRVLAIKGEDDDFRKGMIEAYSAMTRCMPENGLQIIMFTHKSGSIWADMANIVWASGLQVTAAWYVVTETDSALRGGNNVKGTVLLVLRKRQGEFKTNRGDLGWELQEEVEEQVKTLTGLNQDAKSLYRDENLFSDADLQMAGYAAALRVLTKYTFIDGKDMRVEAGRPKVKGQKSFVEELINFAVETANSALVPLGIDRSIWEKLTPGERFYLKMLDMEAAGYKTLDNYQNFAKAFKVMDYQLYMGDGRANKACLKSSLDFGRLEMTGTSELAGTRLRGLLYALMELTKEIDTDLVMEHLSMNVSNYYNVRLDLVDISDYLAAKLELIRPEEASQARVLRDLLRNQKLSNWDRT